MSVVRLTSSAERKFASMVGHQVTTGVPSAWAGSPGCLLPRGEWAAVAEPPLPEISWGHLYVATPPRMYRVLRMLGTALAEIESERTDRAIVIDGARCIPAVEAPELNLADGFFVSIGCTPCEETASLSRSTRCPNSGGGLRSWDWAAIGVSCSFESRLRALLQFGCDPRICSDLSSLTAALDNFVSVLPMRGFAPLSDFVSGVVDWPEFTFLTNPGWSTVDGHFVTPCGHPSAVGLWNLHNLVGHTSNIELGSECVRMPGGIEIDAPMSAAMSEGLQEYLDGRASLPPDPWNDGPSAFLAWLEAPKETWRPGSSRYWDKVRDLRSDVAFAFPDPDGQDAQAFREWCDKRFVREQFSPLLAPPTDPASFVEVPEKVDQAPGINLIGYLNKGLGLGEVARTIRNQAQEHGHPVSTFPYWRSSSPTEFDASPPFILPYTSNLVVIAADQIRFLLNETPSALWKDHFNVGYWFWEVEGVPEQMISAASSFDEIWVATDFVCGALSDALDIPVRRVPLPIRDLESSKETMDDHDQAAGPCRFLVTLDLNSVIVRKNPIAAIDAYMMAFPDEIPGGPRLVVKTMNGYLHPTALHSLQSRASSRSDIEVSDGVLSRSDQDALIASSSCLVSLHRSEGLGLHLQEAMALGVPVIATGYSGNLDFMNSSNSLLIDYQLVTIKEGGPYAGCGMWAEPDIESAAQAMRQIEGDSRLREHLSQAARESIQLYSSDAEASLVAALDEIVVRSLDAIPGL